MHSNVRTHVRARGDSVWEFWPHSEQLKTKTHRRPTKSTTSHHNFTTRALTQHLGGIEVPDICHHFGTLALGLRGNSFTRHRCSQAKSSSQQINRKRLAQCNYLHLYVQYNCNVPQTFIFQHTAAPCIYTESGQIYGRVPYLIWD